MAGFFDAQRRYTPRLPLDDDATTRSLVSAGYFCGALLVVLLAAMAFETRTLDGANVWVKPVKFAVSLGIHFVTLAVLAQQVPRAVRTGPFLSFFTVAAVASLMLEAGYLNVQAARARRSHFNFDTPTESLMYAMMGVGAIFLILVALVLAVQVWRKGQKELPGLRLGTILGLALGFVMTLGFAGFMSSQGWRLVGEPETGAAVPLFGWSREVGDLRPAHFIATHMMQTMPLIGYALDKAGPKLPVRALVILAAVIQTALAAGLFFQALAGKPFWPV